MALLTKCIFEFIGTLILVLLGDGVVASSLLNKSKGQGGGFCGAAIAAIGFVLLYQVL